MVHTTAPVVWKERIDIIDALRGVAILGILLMYISGYSISGDPFMDLWVVVAAIDLLEEIAINKAR